MLGNTLPCHQHSDGVTDNVCVDVASGQRFLKALSCSQRQREVTEGGCVCRSCPPGGTGSQGAATVVAVEGEQSRAASCDGNESVPPRGATSWHQWWPSWVRLSSMLSQLFPSQ